MRIISSIEEALDSVGQDFGASDWVTVGQDRIEAFADATRDHQWIHVDVERARTESPYRSTIAHGFLTLSLISPCGTRSNSTARSSRRP
jgi:acyl dehydratase